MAEISTAAALWGAVAASGVYHGVNPGMGWPLAVSAALMDRSQGSLWRALAALAAGHLLAMAAILFPFSALMVLAQWQREIQIGAACMVIALGLYLLWNRRHPRFLARVPPSRLVLWSFLAAMAHGAGLMLVPIYLGICRTVETDAGHAAAGTLITGNAGIAALVALLHTAAMTAAGGALAYGIYRWVGLKFLSKGWFNLDLVWALSLVLVGSISLLTLP
ncbi:hypothetical protein K3718_11145 [Leisingera aquaemixtae]|uniref:Arginine/ornithine antiporter ArcD n=1 Tax=Leisingera aquaemixtae TaxID=1396826 RepID=A0ABY5WF74_9RHOB|nr:hypothetical protein [Leisingera aquaemixtae]UWQ40125.1 hypothetical protein K3718_11145 [Leisingera aquaemixtae]